MLPCSHGASTLGKTFRRPIMNTIHSFETSAPAATENMRSVSRSAGRSLSNAARPRTASPQLRTWHPSSGIVFRSMSSTPRSASEPPILEAQLEEAQRTTADDVYAVSAADTALLEEPVVVEDPALEDSVLKDPEQDIVHETLSSYKMPEEVFRAAKNADPESPESYWTHKFYRSPPDADGKLKRPTIHYCRTVFTTEKVIKEHFTGKKVIGFDIEWAPDSYTLSGARRNVSLVQIACEDRIALFHLALYPTATAEGESELVAPSLRRIMEDVNITKVGVAIKADCTRLRKHLNVHPKGIFELSHLHKLVKFSKTKDYDLVDRRLVSLARQVQEHLHLPLFKGSNVRQTDWSKRLTMEEIQYAASDSYAGFQLYHTLELKRAALDPVPPLPYFAETGLAIRVSKDVEIPVEPETTKVEEEETTVQSDTAKVLLNDAKMSLRSRAIRKSFIKGAIAEAATNESIAVDSAKDSKPLPPPASSHSFLDTLTSPSTKSKSLSPPKPKSPTPPKLGDTSHIPLKPSALRSRAQNTYFIWLHNPTLSLDDIGAKLRSPPLASRAVAKTIIEAIVADKLPYEKPRLVEVLAVNAVAMGGRYIREHQYWELAEDSGYNKLYEEEEEEGKGSG